ncbi:hypothetical protein C8R45DRAFT_932012 [Mycena sanguinolenta]|nr:hypothetical protein C8R45DRAFT_932012 [Mycena sanguinolenta]
MVQGAYGRPGRLWHTWESKHCSRLSRQSLNYARTGLMDIHYDVAGLCKVPTSVPDTSGKVVCRREWSTRQARKGGTGRLSMWVLSTPKRGSSAGKAEAGRDGALTRSRPVRKGTRELEMRPEAAQQERSCRELEARARAKKRGAGPRAPNRSKREGNKDSGDEDEERGQRRAPTIWQKNDDTTKDSTKSVGSKSVLSTQLSRCRSDAKENATQKSGLGEDVANKGGVINAPDNANREDGRIRGKPSTMRNECRNQVDSQ